MAVMPFRMFCLIAVLFAGTQICMTRADIIISKLHIKSDITYRFVTTHVYSRMANWAKAAEEVTFLVTMPATAFISKFQMIIDGQNISGEVKEKQQAKKQYDQAKKQGESAGHVAASVRDTNEYEVSVNVAANKKVSFNLWYQEVLHRRLGVYEHVINIDPGQIVQDLKVEVNVVEYHKIRNLFVPEIRREGSNQKQETVNSDAVIEFNQPTSAKIKYTPSPNRQRKFGSSLVGQFVVQYDVQRNLGAGEFLVCGGYFVHMFAPTGLPPIPKNILFMLDTSGSMRGKKMQQLKVAMSTILNDLQCEDRFNILPFASQTSLWRKSLTGASEQAKTEAKRMVNALIASGLTAVDDAFKLGIPFLTGILNQADDEMTRPNIIIFLTDGSPTSGETRTSKILQNIRNLNKDDIIIYSLGFGKDVNFDLIQSISLQNKGYAKRIYEASDASIQLINFYLQVSTPLLQNINIAYTGAATVKTTKYNYNAYFSGEELIVAGKISPWTPDVLKHLRFQVSATNMGRPLKISGDVKSHCVRRCTQGLTDIAKRMWAYLSIKDYLKFAESGQQSYSDKALQLSLKYHFVTELTSMVVTLPKKPNTNNAECNPVQQPPSEWSAWSSWSPCSLTCGGGTSHRFRKCLISNCRSGTPTETKTCNTRKCHADPSSWEQWSRCSVTCGQGRQERFRQCSGNTQCTSKDTKVCSLSKCNSGGGGGGWSARRSTRRAGGWRRRSIRHFYKPSVSKNVWSSWGSWHSCSVRCDEGTSSRFRSCLSHPCQGSNSETKSCKRPKCSVCDSQPCRNGGTCKETNTGYSCSCKNAFSGLNCETNPCNADEFDCGKSKCIPRSWVCDNDDDCDNGRDEQGCVCDSQPCQNAGTCFPSQSATAYQCSCSQGFSGKTCENSTCGKDRFDCGNVCIQQAWVCDDDEDCENGRDEKGCGQDGTWGPWSSCPVTCGFGIQERIRTCQSPICRAVDKWPCPTQAKCPAMSQWSRWSVCEARCGAQTRTRTCRGQNCNLESLEESKTCLMAACSAPPPIYIQLRSGAVCLHWPRMRVTSHQLLTTKGWTVRAVHAAGIMQSVYVTGPLKDQTYVITPGNLLLPTGLHSWGQNYKGPHVTVTGNLAQLSLPNGLNLQVQRDFDRIILKTKSAGLPWGSTGLLGGVSRWSLTGDKLSVPGKQKFSTSLITAAGFTCRKPAADILAVSGNP